MVLILLTTAPTSAGSPPRGTCLPITRLISIFSAPCGYLVFATTTSKFSQSAVFAFNSSIASGLLSSITMIPFLASTVLTIAFKPKTTSSANSKSTLWSAVRSGSHSQPFNKTASIGLFGFSFTEVGKPAPPIPTIPLARTISIISSGVRLSRSLFGLIDSCRVFFPSDLITTDIHRPLVACPCSSIAVTVPLTLE